MGAAEALNYDYDVIDTPISNGNDQTVRCYTDSELNTAFANLLKDSLDGLHKTELEAEGLEIRKRKKELIIRRKKKAKLISLLEQSMMIIILLLIPLVGCLFVRDTVYLNMYFITGPAALYFIADLIDIW